MTSDKNQVGFSQAGRTQADDVFERGGFKQLQDAYLLAIAVALLKGLDPAPENLKRDTYLNMAGVDSRGGIRTAILQLRDDAGDRPYALAERLAESGFEDLHRHLSAGRSMREYLSGLGIDQPADEGD
jgi:hypothetical protein